jgi:hypothetical protein
MSKILLPQEFMSHLKEANETYRRELWRIHKQAVADFVAAHPGFGYRAFHYWNPSSTISKTRFNKLVREIGADAAKADILRFLDETAALGPKVWDSARRTYKFYTDWAERNKAARLDPATFRRLLLEALPDTTVFEWKGREQFSGFFIIPESLRPRP